jgi:YD repeat-containing protein
MTDPILGTTTYTYDGARRLTSTANSNGTTSYAYDRAGNLSSVGYPQNGGSVSYGYDALSRVVSVTDRSIRSSSSGTTRG